MSTHQSLPMVHRLKCVEPYFSEQWNGLKNFEVRTTDRPYTVGDFILLEKWSPGLDMLMRQRSYMLLQITSIVKHDPPHVEIGEKNAILGTRVLARSRHEP